MQMYDYYSIFATIVINYYDKHNDFTKSCKIIIIAVEDKNGKCDLIGS